MTPWVRKHDGRTVLLVEMTLPQLTALRSLVAAHLQVPGHVEEYLDVARDVTTTPEELLQMLLEQDIS